MHAARSSHVLCDGIVIVALLVSMAAAVVGAGPPTASVPATASAPALGTLPLSLQPTELTLVDGRKVQGQLACEMDDRLVLYSPNLGSVASFEKRFVAEYVVLKDKKKIMLNPARPLTAEESDYWGWKGWPDAAPEKGPVPAYAKESWIPPKRLLVWAKPGENGDFSKTESWLVYGEPLVTGKWWDEQTDVLLPSAPNRYILVSGNHPELPEGGRLSYTARHIMVERNGLIQTSGCSVFGNEWVHRGGKTGIRFGHTWAGSRNTYARFDFLPVMPLGTSDLDVIFGVGEAKDAEHYRPESELDIGQYLGVSKDGNASVELLGCFGSRDKFIATKGTAIAGPDMQFSTSNRNSDYVHPGATLVLLDGAIWGKRGDFGIRNSMDVYGTLQAGLPDRPLTRDATLILNAKDYQGTGSHEFGATGTKDDAGMRLYPGGTMRVHSSDPAKARLVIRCGLSDRQSSVKLIDVVLLGDAVLDGVVFMDLWKGGLRLKDLKQKKAWKHVSFVDCQSQKPEELYAVYQKDTPPSGYTENPAMPVLSFSGGKPEPAVANDAALDKLRQELEAAEARCKELERAYRAIVGDDDAFCQGIATYGLAKVEAHKAKRALWLAFAERLKATGTATTPEP